MVEFMRDIGVTICDMDRVTKSIKMVILTTVNLNVEKLMAKGSTSG